MKNNSFKIIPKSIFIDKKIDFWNEGHKRAKSNALLLNSILDDLKIIEPKNNKKNKNNISKLLSIKNEETNKIKNNNNIINKSFKNKKIIIHNKLKNQKKFITLNHISHIENKQK